ncbi:HAMP domain-containing sensor histidine kinase [Paenibacillus ginsengarvi]|uniref:histidine kinase n=1 Tax=Paenibacillus ginsengarvi TaxID=400777 RepID=A0A3B0CGF8_9BACL|nr:HAMP domain-containing sensor histidine kinase [Paenibacillus ginsengarvi]RKN84432.1 sensor histidine kinase [Paenibacillus ginsengarvi]
MKLIYRLNISFGLLLLGILTLTAALIYPLLLNTLVDGQRKEMREQGSAMLSLTPAMQVQEGKPAEQTTTANRAPFTRIQTIVTTPAENVIYSTLPPEQATEWVAISKTYDLSNGIWQGKDGDYIVETLSSGGASVTNAVTAIMATPLSQVKAMQMELFKRMIVILSIGGLLTFLLCMFITRKLVKPLEKLKQELKKVEARRFSEVGLVKSGGEIGEVAESVYQLAGELENYQRIQKQFFQNASHELKTPLMSIQGYAEGIKDGIFTGDKAAKGLDIIASECERLKKIVGEMILLAKLESEDGIFHMDQVAVQELMTETVERISPLLLKKGLNVELDWSSGEGGRTIYADREKLLQALLNITGNAARYAKETIQISATARDSSIDIEIADDGEGIPEQLLPHLFGRFSKGKNGETGLGLAISRAIVERCRGQITASNRPSGGAAVVMRFPQYAVK